MKIRLMLASNNDNGYPAGSFDSLEIPDVLTLEGPPVPGGFDGDHILKAGYLRLSIRGHRTWVGNICWDSCLIDSANATLLVNHLRDEYGWGYTEAEVTIARLYKKYLPTRWLEKVVGGKYTILDHAFIRWLDLKEWWHKSTLQKWTKQKRHEREAQSWLKANNPDLLACQLMFALNRQTKEMRRHGPSQGMIYNLKSALIKHLWDQGYCQGVSLQKQEMECWSCEGSGWYSDLEECYKCEGTGIYRTYWLYKFIFEISGQTFVWHQPKALALWVNKVTRDGDSIYREWVTNFQVLNPDITSLYIVTVREYLIQQGIEVPNLLTLRKATKDDFGVHWWQFKRRVRTTQDRWEQIKDFLRTGEWPRLEDDIPF